MAAVIDSPHDAGISVLEKFNLPHLPDDGEPNIYPRVEQAWWIFTIQQKGRESQAELVEKLASYVYKNNLAYYYKYLCDVGVLIMDESKYLVMKELTDTNIQNIQEAMKKVGGNYDHISKRQLQNLYPNYLSYVGDKEEALNYLVNEYASFDTISSKIENHFHRCRIGFFYQDRFLVEKSLKEISDLIKKSPDWHLKNMFYAYNALYHLWNRDIKTACSNFLSCISSFASYDLMSLPMFSAYTSICAMLVLDREKFTQKIISGHEIQEGLYHVPVVRKLCEAFHTCDYTEFTKSLKSLTNNLLSDIFCSQHADYICKKFRLKAYTQLMISFKSLTLKYLADVFCLREDFIEMDIAAFIAKGDLNCKIDLVRGMVITSHSDNRNASFMEFVNESRKLVKTIQCLERTVEE